MFGVRSRPRRRSAGARPDPPPRPLNEHTNGHAAARHVDDDEDEEDEVEASLALTPDTSSEETGVRASVTQSERAFLRQASPSQLVALRAWQEDVHLLLWLVVVRAIIAVITSRTQSAPDEHWQSLEIAHRIVFQYGWQTWEWIDRRPETEHILSARHWGDGPIRTVAYPALFVPAYSLLARTGLDGYVLLLTTLPSLIQSFFAAVTDWYTFRLARKVLSERAAWATLLSSLTSMYAFHSYSRTLSNSMEAALTGAALFYWPLSLPEDSDSDFIGDLPLVDAPSMLKAVTLFAISAALRPSNVLLSGALFFLLLRRVAMHVKSAATALEATFSLIVVFRTVLFVGLVSTSALLCLDSFYFQRLTFTPLAFLKRNVLQGISVFYGASPFHFYLTSALPFIGFTTLPFILRGFWFAFRKPPVSSFDKTTRRWIGYRGENDPAAVNTLANACILFIAAMSLLGHKEVRFLQPIVPIFYIMQGYALVMLLPFRDSSLLGRWTSRSPAARSNSRPNRALARQAHQDRAGRAELLQSLRTFTSWQGRHHLLPPRPYWRSTLVYTKLRDVIRFVRVWHGKHAILALALHLPPIVYLSFHSSGQIRVAQHVGTLSRAGHLHSVGFIMPCHSTPWQSHMHHAALSHDKRAWFITCEPPLEHDGLSLYKDESDRFYDDPASFIRTEIGTVHRPWPSHLVAFEALLKDTEVATMLLEEGYHVRKTFWNSLVHLDARRRGRILLLERDRDDQGARRTETKERMAIQLK